MKKQICDLDSLVGACICHSSGEQLQLSLRFRRQYISFSSSVNVHYIKINKNYSRVLMFLQKMYSLLAVV
jgi:hypothetical protein